MINEIKCFFKGHIKISRKREKEIAYAIKMYGYDIWGSSAFGNIDQIDILTRELVSCVRCHKILPKGQ